MTFCKRKAGLLKKAYELSILCQCVIALFVFSDHGKLHQYSSKPVEKILKQVSEYPQHESTEIRTNEDLGKVTRVQVFSSITSFFYFYSYLTLELSIPKKSPTCLRMMRNTRKKTFLLVCPMQHQLMLRLTTLTDKVISMTLLNKITWTFDCLILHIDLPRQTKGRMGA